MAVDLTEANQYGIGKGSAFVWGNNRGLQGLERAYQQEQLRKQKEEAELADQLAKINTDGVRDADLDPVMKSYSELKNTFSQIRGTKDQTERIKLQARLNQQKTELSRAVSVSKAAAQEEVNLGKIPLTNADNVSDDFVPNYSKLRSTSVFDPKYKAQAEYLMTNGVMPKFDAIDVHKKLADASIDKLDESAVKVQNLGGGVKSYYTENGTKLNKEALTENVIKEAQSNKGMMRAIAKQYPNLPITDAVKAYSDDLYESLKGKYDVKERAGASVKEPDRYYDHFNYSRANGGANDAAIYRQNQINEIFSGQGAWTDENSTINRLKSAMSANPKYSKLNVNTAIRDVGKYVHFDIPTTVQKYTTKDEEGNDVVHEKKIDGYKVTIDRTNPQDRIKLNKVLDVITGDKISESKVQTGNAGGKIKSGIYTEKNKNTAPKSGKKQIKGW